MSRLAIAYDSLVVCVVSTHVTKSRMPNFLPTPCRMGPIDCLCSKSKFLFMLKTCAPYLAAQTMMLCLCEKKCCRYQQILNALFLRKEKFSYLRVVVITYTGVLGLNSMQMSSSTLGVAVGGTTYHLHTIGGKKGFERIR